MGEGQLKVQNGLRKGDELVHFFETFADMVRDLRKRQESEIAMLDEALESLRGKAADEDLKPLEDLRKEMQDALG